MTDPRQADFNSDPNRINLHNNEGDLGTEIRSADMRECKAYFRNHLHEPTGHVADTVITSLPLRPNIRPLDLKKVARTLQRERAALFPSINFDDPNYKSSCQPCKVKITNTYYIMKLNNK